MVELRSPGGIDDTSHGDGTFKEGDKESKRLNGIACVGGLVRRRIGRRLFRRAIFRLRALWRRRSNHPVLSESQCFVCTVWSNLFRRLLDLVLDLLLHRAKPSHFGSGTTKRVIR